MAMNIDEEAIRAADRVVDIEDEIIGGSDRKTWSHQETIDFIILAKERQLFADTHSIKCRNKYAFQIMKEDMEKLGYEVTLKQIRRKWKSLKEHYYKILSQSSRRVRWCYFDAMHEILGMSPKSLFLQSRFGQVTASETSAHMKLKEDPFANAVNILPIIHDNSPPECLDNRSLENADTESHASMDDAAVCSLPSSGSSEKILKIPNVYSLYQAEAQHMPPLMPGPEEEHRDVFERPYMNNQQQLLNDTRDMNALVQMEIMKLLKDATKESKREPDRFDNFGVFIASHLRAMTEDKSNTVMRNLSRTLFEND